MKYAVSLLLLTSAMTAHADFKLFGQSRENTSYYDADSIKRSGPMVSVWTLTEYRQAEKAGFLSTRSHKELDCKKQQDRTLQYIAYAENKGQGQVVGGINEPSDWQDIAPGTRNSRLLQMVCGT
jgi:hypothetical protein